MIYVCMICYKLIQEKEAIRMPFTFEKVPHIYCRKCYNNWAFNDKKIKEEK